jgi:hypothetical protein
VANVGNFVGAARRCRGFGVWRLPRKLTFVEREVLAGITRKVSPKNWPLKDHLRPCCKNNNNTNNNMPKSLACVSLTPRKKTQQQMIEIQNIERIAKSARAKPP